MAFGGSYSGFSPLTFESANRAQAQNGYVQQQGGGGGGGFLSNLLGLAGTVTSFIPGAQVASPFLNAGAAVMGGDVTGGAQQAAQAAMAQPGQQGGGGATPEIQQDEPEPPQDILGPDADDNNQNVDPNFSTQFDLQQYLNQYFMQNPYLLMAMQGQGAQMPGMGFSQFGPGVM